MYLAFLVAPVFQVIGMDPVDRRWRAGPHTEILHERPEDEDPLRVGTIGVIQGYVQFDNAGLQYDARQGVLHDVSFTSGPP